MPLEQTQIDTILNYCDAHLPDKDWFDAEFSFIDDDKLRQRLAFEFQAARYVYKLGEALSTSGNKLHAHVKFQIVQYASIYEAVIVHLLWVRFAEHPAVAEIEFHQTLRVAATWPKSVSVTSLEGEQLYLCVNKTEKTPRVSIKFDDKVDAAVKIGFVTSALGEEIKSFYRLRNAIHVESAVKNAIKYELDQSILAYRRLRPFVDGIRDFLAPGSTRPAKRKSKTT